MAAFTHAIYIDESGNGAPVRGIQSYWVTTAVAVSFSNLDDLNSGSKSILKRYFRQGEKELKGKNMPNRLLKDISIDRAVEEIATILIRVDAKVWITYAHNDGPTSPIEVPRQKMAKEIARRAMLERINDYLNAGHHDSDQFLIIWDISYQQELEDFSHSVATFRHNLTGNSLNPWDCQQPFRLKRIFSRRKQGHHY